MNALKGIRHPADLFTKRTIENATRTYVRQCVNNMKRTESLECLEKEPVDENVLHTYPHGYVILAEHDLAIPKKLLMDLLDSLNPLQKKIMYLYYFEDMKEQDIAMCLGIPRTTCQSKRYSALKQMKKRIDAELERYQ